MFFIQVCSLNAIPTQLGAARMRTSCGGKYQQCNKTVLETYQEWEKLETRHGTTAKYVLEYTYILYVRMIRACSQIFSFDKY